MRYGDAFTAGYRERFDAVEALTDIAQFEQLKQAVRVRAIACRATVRKRCAASFIHAAKSWRYQP
ncbi:MAG: hypothetical protein WDN76_03650 [Alphaproteobacteria bacterium]